MKRGVRQWSSENAEGGGLGHRQWYKAGCGWARLPLRGVYVGVCVSVGQGGSRRRGTHGKNRGGEDSEGRLGLLARRRW